MCIPRKKPRIRKSCIRMITWKIVFAWFCKSFWWLDTNPWQNVKHLFVGYRAGLDRGLGKKGRIQIMYFSISKCPSLKGFQNVFLIVRVVSFFLVFLEEKADEMHARITSFKGLQLFRLYKCVLLGKYPDWCSVSPSLLKKMTCVTLLSAFP